MENFTPLPKKDEKLNAVKFSKSIKKSKTNPDEWAQINLQNKYFFLNIKMKMESKFKFKNRMYIIIIKFELNTVADLACYYSNISAHRRYILTKLHN